MSELCFGTEQAWNVRDAGRTSVYTITRTTCWQARLRLSGHQGKLRATCHGLHRSQPPKPAIIVLFHELRADTEPQTLNLKTLRCLDEAQRNEYPSVSS